MYAVHLGEIRFIEQTRLLPTTHMLNVWGHDKWITNTVMPSTPDSPQQLTVLECSVLWRVPSLIEKHCLWKKKNPENYFFWFLNHSLWDGDVSDTSPVGQQEDSTSKAPGLGALISLYFCGENLLGTAKADTIILFTSNSCMFLIDTTVPLHATWHRFVRDV